MSVPRLLLLSTVLLCGAVGCRRHPAPAVPPPAPPVVSAPASDAPRSAMRQQDGTRPQLPEPRPLRRCFPGDLAGSPPRILDVLLDRSADLFDGGEFEGSLACAEEAARTEPGSVEAHHE